MCTLFPTSGGYLQTEVQIDTKLMSPRLPPKMDKTCENVTFRKPELAYVTQL